MRRKSKNLSKAEVAALIDAIRQGGREGEMAKDLLVRRNMGIVSLIAKKYGTYCLPEEDLIQEGAMGLLTAIERFDPTRGFSFSTYASYWIRAKIIRAIEYSPMIRPSSVLRDQDRAVRSLVNQEEGKRSRELTRKELADLAGMTTKKLEILQLCLQTPLSLNQFSVVNNHETEQTLEEVVADPNAECAFERAEEAQLRELVTASLARLPMRERDIVRRWIDGESYTKIGNRHGVTRERIRQILLDALKFLAKCRYKNELKTMWAA